MKRREFIELFGGALMAWPLPAGAQQAEIPVVGFLRSTSPAGAEHLVAALRQGLADTGHIEGQNVAIEYRWANNDVARLPELAADLVRRQVAVIVVNGVAVKPAIAATSTIPIVFVIGIDPVRSGLVASLNRPGGNVTGTSIVSIDLDAKRLGFSSTRSRRKRPSARSCSTRTSWKPKSRLDRWRRPHARSGCRSWS